MVGNNAVIGAGIGFVVGLMLSLDFFVLLVLIILGFLIGKSLKQKKGRVGGQRRGRRR